MRFYWYTGSNFQTENVRKKFAKGGTWQNRWPTHVETYESEWARFKAA